MDPTGPSQPSLDTVYGTEGNPVDQSQQEQHKASQSAQSNDGSLIEKRERGDIPVPSTHEQEPTSSSLGYGVRDDKGDRSGPFGEPTTEAEQMRAPGEGEIAEAQDNKTGFGEQADLASDLDKKKAEQADARTEMKEQRAEGVDVGDTFGSIGGTVV